MNQRDDFFYQAVIYAKEKNYKAARSMLRNLLFQYPDDIEGLLLYSIVAPNKEISIKALKRVLLIDPDHEIAFKKLVHLKQATPASFPAPTAPLPIPTPMPVRQPVNAAIAARANGVAAQPMMTPPPPTPQPAAKGNIEEMALRKRLEQRKAMQVEEAPTLSNRRKKKNIFDLVLIGLVILTCLCLVAASSQQIIFFLIENF